MLLEIVTLISANAGDCNFYGVNAGAPVWNGTILVDNAFAQQMRASGAGSVRVNFRLDTHTTWDDDAFATYDAIIAAIVDAGLEPLGLVGYEAVDGDQTQWNDDADGDGYNDYVDTFANTAVALFTRYGDRVKLWEIWNEPNCYANDDYATNPQAAGCTYIEPHILAKALAEIDVRGGDLLQQQGGQLVLGGLLAHDLDGDFSTASPYLSDVVGDSVFDWLSANRGHRYPWSGVGYHVYIEQDQRADPAMLNAYLDDVREVLDAAGDMSPFFLTEAGWSTSSVSPDLQADDLGVFYATMSARADVSRAYWFSFQDVPAADLFYGLVDENGNAKPARDAMLAASACPSVSTSAIAGGSPLPSTSSSRDVKPRFGLFEVNAGSCASGSGALPLALVALVFVRRRVRY